MGRILSRYGGPAGYYTTTSALAVLFLFPLVWSGWSSLRGRYGSPQSSGYGFGNYTALLHYGAGVGTYTLNSAYVSALTVIGTLVVASLGGYAFARFTFPGKNLLFLATLAILMVPYATILIPLYVFLGYLHLQNTLTGLALVFVMFQLPFATFMMRNSFESVPRELEEAALVDGCGTFQALTRVLLRAVRPGLLTVALFAFLASWNDFFATLVLINDDAKFTLPVAVATITDNTFGGVLESGVMIMALPALILFLLLQRHYTRGFTTGALGG